MKYGRLNNNYKMRDTMIKKAEIIKRIEQRYQRAKKLRAGYKDVPNSKMYFKYTCLCRELAYLLEFIDNCKQEK